MSARTSRGSGEQHAFLAIRVSAYEARTEAGLNISLVGGRPFDDDPEDFVFAFGTQVVINGVSTYPAERAGENFEITLRASDGSSWRPRLKDIHTRDEHQSPVYRKYRGEHYAVYKPPPGLGTLERRRTDKTWQCYLPVEPKLTTDMLILLTQSRQLYVYIHEKKSDRRRWIQSISLQTTDPAEE